MKPSNADSGKRIDFAETISDHISLLTSLLKKYKKVKKSRGKFHTKHRNDDRFSFSTMITLQLQQMLTFSKDWF